MVPGNMLELLNEARDRRAAAIAEARAAAVPPTCRFPGCDLRSQGPDGSDDGAGGVFCSRSHADAFKSMAAAKRDSSSTEFSGMAIADREKMRDMVAQIEEAHSETIGLLEEERDRNDDLLAQLRAKNNDLRRFENDWDNSLDALQEYDLGMITQDESVLKLRANPRPSRSPVAHGYLDSNACKRKDIRMAPSHCRQR